MSVNSDVVSYFRCFRGLVSVQCVYDAAARGVSLVMGPAQLVMSVF